MIKEYQIEETIVAYFDGRLTDTESAELLHRVSISPEIRQLFTEHEMLRNMAYRTARNVSIPTELEESLFAHIASLQEDEKGIALLPEAEGFWSIRRISVAAAVVAILLAGAVESLHYNSNEPLNGTQAIRTSQISGPSAESEGLHTSQPSTMALQSSHVVGNRAIALNSYHNDGIAETVKEADESSNAPVFGKNDDENIVLAPALRTVELSHINQPSIGGPFSLRDMAYTDVPRRFEIGLSTSSPGVTMPAIGHNLNPFAYEVRAAYNLDEHNQAGIRVASDYFQGLNIAMASTSGFTNITGSMGVKRFATYELFYNRVQAIDGGRFFLSLGLGAGLYSEGNLMSMELGFKLPLGDRLLAGVTFRATRVHQNGASEQELMSSQSVPVIYSGQDIHNTLNGVFLYGLSYQF